MHPSRRWVEHCYHANAQDDMLPIHLAIAKYGRDNFCFTVLEWSEDYDQREHDLIIEYNSLAPNGYNILDGTSNNPVLYGENNYRNTLPQSAIDNIIDELLANTESDVALATKYNTTAKIISDINHGRYNKLEGYTYPLRDNKKV